jgi:hypothetical protein
MFLSHLIGRRAANAASAARLQIDIEFPARESVSFPLWRPILFGIVRAV